MILGGGNVIVLLEVNVNSCYMLDCIRIAMLGINILLGFIIVRS